MARHCTRSQCDALLILLQSGPVTSLQALDQLGIARAAARVHDLREAGWNIDTRMVTVTNRRGEDCRVAQYSLVSTQRMFPLDALMKKQQREAA